MEGPEIGGRGGARTARILWPLRCRTAGDQRRLVPVPPAHDVEDAPRAPGRRRGVQDRHRVQRLAALLGRRRVRAIEHPPLDHRERPSRRDRRAAGPAFLQHRHLHLCLARDQPQGARAAWARAADRWHAVLPADEEKPEQQAQRDHRGSDPPPHPHLWRLSRW